MTMRRLLALVIGIAVLLSAWSVAVAAPSGTIDLTVACNTWPERTTITNNTDETLNLSGWTLGSLYQPGSDEPFALSGTLDPGKSVTYESGLFASQNVLSSLPIYGNAAPSQGARLTTGFGTLDVLCSDGSGSLMVEGTPPPPPSTLERPVFLNLTPAPFTTVAPGDVRLAVVVYGDTAIDQLSFKLNGEELNPEIGGPADYRVAAFTERTLSSGVYTLTAVAKDHEGDEFRAEWDFVVSSNPAESEWFTASGVPKAAQLNATLRSLVEAFRWHLYGQSWDGANHPELPTHVGLTGQGTPLETWVSGTTVNRSTTEATLRSLVEAFRWHFWGISWDNQAHCDVPTHIADCHAFLPPQGIDPWFDAQGNPIRANIEATLRSLVESFRWHFWGYSWDGGPHPEIPTHGY
jgi:hypothetical protein